MTSELRRCFRIAGPVWYGMVTPKQIGGSAGAGESPQGASYGLRRGGLSPLETLAQSVGTTPPTAAPGATGPPVCPFARHRPWLPDFFGDSAALLLCRVRGEFPGL